MTRTYGTSQMTFYVQQKTSMPFNYLKISHQPNTKYLPAKKTKTKTHNHKSESKVYVSAIHRPTIRQSGTAYRQIWFKNQLETEWDALSGHIILAETIANQNTTKLSQLTEAN